MSVTITITGSDAAEAVKELSSLAKSVVPSGTYVAANETPATAPKAEEPKKPKPADKPKAEPVAEKPKPAEEPKKPDAPAGLTLPKDGGEREKAALAFMKEALADFDKKHAELALYPADDQYTLLRQCGIELMQTGRGEAFKEANAKAGIPALTAIKADSAKMLTHFKTLIDLLSV